MATKKKSAEKVSCLYCGKEIAKTAKDIEAHINKDHPAKAGLMREIRWHYKV